MSRISVLSEYQEVLAFKNETAKEWEGKKCRNKMMNRWADKYPNSGYSTTEFNFF